MEPTPFANEIVYFICTVYKMVRSGLLLAHKSHQFALPFMHYILTSNSSYDKLFETFNLMLPFCFRNKDQIESGS